MTSAFTWAFGFLTGATVGWICRARQLPMSPPKGSCGGNEITLQEWEAMRTPPPVRFDEGRTKRGNGNGGSTTPKPQIVPKPQSPTANL